MQELKESARQGAYILVKQKTIVKYKTNWEFCKFQNNFFEILSIDEHKKTQKTMIFFKQILLKIIVTRAKLPFKNHFTCWSFCPVHHSA